MSDVRTVPAQRAAEPDAAPKLSGVRRGAFAVYRVLIVVFLVALLAQVFLAGLGIFGSEVAVTEDASTELDPHRFLGHILFPPVMLLVLLTAVIARPGRRILPLTALLFVDGVLQVVLAVAGGDTPVLGGLHAFNAIILITLTAYLVRLANPTLGRRSR